MGVASDDLTEILCRSSSFVAGRRNVHWLGQQRPLCCCQKTVNWLQRVALLVELDKRSCNDRLGEVALPLFGDGEDVADVTLAHVLPLCC